MKNENWLVVFWVGLIILLGLFFPERVKELLQEKVFAFIIIVAAFLVGFFIWLKFKHRD